MFQLSNNTPVSFCESLSVSLRGSDTDSGLVGPEIADSILEKNIPIFSSSKCFTFISNNYDIISK
jgi:hypothetical protein